jgi:transposase-like protein
VGGEAYTGSGGEPPSQTRGPIDETYIRVRGQWRYRNRAIDHDGALVDVMLSKYCDLAAAKAFSRSAKTVTGVTPGPGHDRRP